MRMKAAPPDWRERGLVSVPQAGAVIGVGPTTAYAMARAGQMPTMIVGRTMKVPTAWLRRLVDEGTTVVGAA